MYVRYRSSLEIASLNNVAHVAFPALSCGVFAYPLDDAADAALEVIREFDLNQKGEVVKSVSFVLFGKPVADAWIGAAERMGMKVAI
jgi:O-acetyl-ADP-ribose deacetylase